MKLIFSILICLLLVSSVKAQFSRNEDGQIIPFSQTEKYKSLIDTSKINTCKLKSYNNDSLYSALNKENTRGAYIGSIPPIDTLINLKSVATKYRINEGTVWLYKIESKTAEKLYITIKQFEIPEGAYICLFPKEEEMKIIGRKVFQKKDINPTLFRKSTIGNQLFVEYFEPKNVDKEANIIISQITYSFSSPFKKKVNTENHLKSGSFGSATNSCQYDVVCREVHDWTKESRSIVYINAIAFLGVTEIISKGTGFFINKSIGYANSDRPYLITAGHIFNPWFQIDNIWTNLDFTNDLFAEIEYWVNYQNLTCNDPVKRTGQLLPGNFSFTAKGSSYNKQMTSNYQDPTFEENEDYAIVQPSMIISELKKYNILYAGWTASPDFNITGYAAIGHPGGDVQKVLYENDKGLISSGGKSVDFYFDKGVPEHGFSGSPIFNTNRKVVGWLSTGDVNASCANVGTDLNIAKCGRFDRLYFTLAPYIDPTGQRQWLDSEQTPPIITVPDHCKNCIKDSDETGIDCGGSCLPCGMQDVKTLKSQTDIIGSNISARYELLTDPDPGTQLEFISGNFNLTAGNSIKLNNTTIKLGVTLKAAIVPSLKSEPARGCQAACIVWPNFFTPSGDGINDYWVIAQSFVKSYSFYVRACHSNTIIYSKPTTPIYENGGIRAWDGTGATITCNTYYITLIYTDCYGTTRNTTFFVQVTGLKSVNINEFQNNITATDIKEGNQFRIIAYPNPTNGKVSIEANNCDLLFDYVLTDMTGKVRNKATSILSSTEIDLSEFSSGIYLLQVKSGEYNQLCKLIKK